MVVRLLGSILLIAFLLTPVAASADGPPPRDLHLVGDHWTAWYPPQLPPETTVHIIQRGDTLWDLAAQFLGDPYLWPQLWERNQYILDAHWIYPGDPLALDLVVTPVEQYVDTGAGDDGNAGEMEDDRFRDVLTADQVGGPPRPLGEESDIYCNGYIAADDELPISLIGSEYNALAPTLAGTANVTSIKGAYGDIDTVRFNMTTGDIVYLDGGSEAGLAPGELYSIIQPQETVVHPLNRTETIGQFFLRVGRVRVLSVQETTAIAEVVHACDGFFSGARLKRFVPEPIPLARVTPMRPANLPLSIEDLEGSPVIVRSEDRLIALGKGHIVYLDIGADDDVIPGDVLTVYRHNKPGLPPVVLGEVGVLTTTPTTAMARIINSRYTIYIGDLLAAK